MGRTKTKAPPLGAHVSVAGGLHLAFERGADIGCDCLQIFVKSPNRWQAKPLEEAAVDQFRRTRESGSIGAVVAHAAYLINLATPDESLREKSRGALLDEYQRCNRLGVDGLVFHPGAHVGSGEEAGLRRIVESLRWVLKATAPSDTRLLVENTAGQGTVHCSTVEELAHVVNEIDDERLGYCIDTCHAFAAGYPIGSERGQGEFFDHIFEQLDIGKLGCIHLNDSQGELGSRRDRHANIGAGHLGNEAFSAWLRTPRLSDVPMILETPLGDDGKGHARDLANLRELAA